MIRRSGLLNHLKSSFIRNFSKVSSTDYCVDLVRRHENENFFCTLLLPKDVRSAAFAVRAFNIEISQIGDKAKDKNMAVARMNFWEDALDKIFSGDPPKHPVALELSRAVKRHGLLKKQFTRLLKARLNAINSSTFLNLNQVEKYAEESVSPLFYLILQAADVKSIEADHAASHLGKAQGLCNLIRSVPYHAARRTVLLPQDILTKHDLTQEDVIRERYAHNLRNAIFDIASSAKIHLDKARSLRKDVPKDAYIIFLPAVAISKFLERLRETDFDIHNEILHDKNIKLGIQLFVSKLFSIY